MENIMAPEYAPESKRQIDFENPQSSTYLFPTIVDNQLWVEYNKHDTKINNKSISLFHSW